MESNPLFSWKKDLQRSIIHLKMREQLYKKQGLNVEAAKLKARIDRAIKHG